MGDTPPGPALILLTSEHEHQPGPGLVSDGHWHWQQEGKQKLRTVKARYFSHCLSHCNWVLPE